MKKSLTFLLATLCIVSCFTLSSCDTGSIDWEDDIYYPSQETEEAEGTVKVPDDLIVSLKEVEPFSDGVAFIKYTAQYEGYEPFKWNSNLAIDKEGNVLFEFYGDYTYYKNGIMIVNDCVYDKKGNIIASPEKSGYDELITDNTYEFLLAYKKEESVYGTTHCVGVLNNKGEWVVPLSSKHPIVQLCEEKGKNVKYVLEPNPTYGTECVGNNIYRFKISERKDDKWYFYDLSTNELTYNYDHFEYKKTPERGIYKTDKDGNSELIIPLSEEYSIVLVDDETLLLENGYCYYLYDHLGNLLVDYSAYKISDTEILSYYNGYLLCVAINPSGTEFITLFDPKGNLVFEPIEYSRFDSFWRTYSYDFVSALDENGFAVRAFTDGSIFYDYSGNAKEIRSNVGTIEEFFSEGLAIVRYFHIGYNPNSYGYLNHQWEEVLNPLNIVLSHILG